MTVASGPSMRTTLVSSDGPSNQVEEVVNRLVSVVGRLSDPSCSIKEREGRMEELREIGGSPLMLESVCVIISDLGRYPPQVGMEALNLLIREGVMKRWGQSPDASNGGRYFEASKDAVRSTLQDAALALENSDMSGKAPVPKNISKPRPVSLPDSMRPCSEAELGRLILSICSLSERVHVASITASQSSVYEMHRQTAYLIQQMVESATNSFLVHHPEHLGAALQAIKLMWNYPSPYLQLCASTALELLARRVCSRAVAGVKNNSGVSDQPCRMAVWNQADTLAEYFYHLWVVCQQEPQAACTDLCQHYRTVGMGSNAGDVPINAYCAVWKRLSEEDAEAYGDDVDMIVGKSKSCALITLRTILSIPDTEVSMRHTTAVRVAATILERDELSLKEYSAALNLLECLLKPFVLPSKPNGQTVADPKANLDETELRSLLSNIVARACVTTFSTTASWTPEHLKRFYDFIPCAVERLPSNVLGGLIEKCMSDGSRPPTMPDGSLNVSMMTTAQNAVLCTCKKLSGMDLDKAQLISSLAGVGESLPRCSVLFLGGGGPPLVGSLSPAESKCIYDEVASTLIRVTEEGCRFECIAIDTAEDIARKAIRLLSMCLSCLSAAEAAEERDTSSPQESSEMDQVLVEFANSITPPVMKWMTLLHNRCSGSWWIPQSERRASSAAEDQLVDMCHDEWTSIMGHKPPCTVEAMFPLPTATPACSDKSRRQLYQLRCNVYRTLGALARVWRRVPTLKCRLIELVGAAVSAAQSGRTSPNHLELLLRYALQPGLKDASSGPLVEASTILYSNIPSALWKVYEKGAPEGDKTSGITSLLFYSAVARCGKTLLDGIRELLKLAQVDTGVDLRLAPAKRPSLPTDGKSLTKRQLRNRNHFAGLDMIDSDDEAEDRDDGDDVVAYLNDRQLIKSLFTALSSLLPIPHLTLSVLSLMNATTCRCWTALPESLETRQNFCLSLVDCFLRPALENLIALPQLAYLGGDGALTDLLGDSGRKQTPLLDGVVKLTTTGYLVLAELFRRQCDVAGSPSTVDELFLCPPLFEATKMLCTFTQDDDGVKGWIELIIDTKQANSMTRKQVGSSLKGMLKNKGKAESKVVVVGEQGGDKQLLDSVAGKSSASS
ncbi:hypothetical protein Pmar_PMAR008930 [Perkinsus marinus ATCC 50983]|uniref:Uncharacterized protein n=1 Tax=Perkinsus marinus (strain ATCC 50983 / TXsc) TaxID=423536 RepID=C5KAD9_PERM5|nr:hypothetical protein Pmar_PMAR008930 [Perkinsus marinus ATCC 50983]EER18600.1 hypothetical protein Pmar_PMAR008930 [Perkinsus marinus ATCC 50983]|eukprot:XP_002786804.1 hypothetical protein Pmar_PMAR008930 [Perkinsus marinus ATCC 50983]